MTQQKNFNKRLFNSVGFFMDWKLQTDLEPNACLAFYQASKVELFTKIVIVNIGTILVQQPSGTIINSIPLDEF